MDVLQPHLPPPQVVVAVHGRQVAVDGCDQVVVDRQRHVVGKQGRGQRAVDSRGPGRSRRRAGSSRSAWRPACSRGPGTAGSTAWNAARRTFRWGECSNCRNVAWLSSTCSPCSFVTRPNFRSASFSWRNTLLAVWAISLCMASSSSSFLPSVCGLKRRIRSSSSRYGPVPWIRRTGSSWRPGSPGSPGG